MDGAGNPVHNPQSGTHAALPPQPITIQTGTLPAVIEASGSAISRLGHLSPTHAQTAIVIVLTLFVCVMLGITFYTVHSQQAETLALIIRSTEAESEKNRNANAEEFARNRDAFAAQSKLNRDAITEGVKMTIDSNAKLSVELGKLEVVVTTLSNTITDLKRKLPPEEEEIVAPMPRLKVDPTASTDNPRSGCPTRYPDRDGSHPHGARGTSRP